MRAERSNVPRDSAAHYEAMTIGKTTRNKKSKKIYEVLNCGSSSRR